MSYKIEKKNCFLSMFKHVKLGPVIVPLNLRKIKRERERSKNKSQTNLPFRHCPWQQKSKRGALLSCFQETG
jgi:hypothetical protein